MNERTRSFSLLSRTFVPQENLVEMDAERVGLPIQQAPLIGQPLAPQRIAKQASNTDANCRLPSLVQRFYGTLEELQSMFPRRFVPEGALDQSLGDVLGAFVY